MDQYIVIEWGTYFKCNYLQIINNNGIIQFQIKKGQKKQKILLINIKYYNMYLIIYIQIKLIIKFYEN